MTSVLEAWTVILDSETIDTLLEASGTQWNQSLEAVMRCQGRCGTLLQHHESAQGRREGRGSMQRSMSRWNRFRSCRGP